MTKFFSNIEKQQTISLILNIVLDRLDKMTIVHLLWYCGAIKMTIQAETLQSENNNQWEKLWLFRDLKFLLLLLKH